MEILLYFIQTRKWIHWKWKVPEFIFLVCITYPNNPVCLFLKYWLLINQHTSCNKIQIFYLLCVWPKNNKIMNYYGNWHLQRMNECVFAYVMVVFQKQRLKNYPKRWQKTVNDVVKIQEVPAVAYFKAQCQNLVENRQHREWKNQREISKCLCNIWIKFLRQFFP